ncbi:MAG TPA: hypothetical protein VN238_16690 [Solirubrobacteraceae bacterium]|nr:hypothetical protein [Solirubrobacteraceae bacterium]
MAETETDRLRTLVREAVGDEKMVGAEPHDGLGGVIINTPGDGALLWIRGGADDERPAVIQATVPFGDGPVDASDEAIAAAVEWLEGSVGRWSPMDPDEGAPE